MRDRKTNAIFVVDGETLGERLCRLRKAQEMTQRDLAELAGISTRALCSYERDQREPPAHNLPILAEALDVSVDEVLGLRQVKDRPQAKISRRWLMKFKQIENLTERKQRAIMQVLDMALQKG